MRFGAERDVLWKLKIAKKPAGKIPAGFYFL
jgi:hypothetical protein